MAINEYYPPNYYRQNYPSYPYTYPAVNTWSYPQSKAIRKVVTEKEYDPAGNLVKETVTETTETVPYYPYTWTNVPGVSWNSAKLNTWADNHLPEGGSAE